MEEAAKLNERDSTGLKHWTGPHQLRRRIPAGPAKTPMLECNA
jgi:hypothetical protein